MDVISQAASYCLGASRALLLPSGDAPRVLMPKVSMRRRWFMSAIYPAFRLRAKPWKLLQRLRAVFFMGSHVPIGDNSTVKEFLEGIVPKVSHTGVLLGVDNSYRKIIVQVWENDCLKGYLKCSTNDEAAKRVAHEASILRQLPDGAGPELLKHDQLNGAETILQSAVVGKPLKASVHALQENLSTLQEYLSTLERDQNYAIEDHPAIISLREQLAHLSPQPPVPSLLDFEEILTPLREREWPRVIQHGDFTPWNVIHRPSSLRAVGSTEPETDIRPLSSALCAIDWEEGNLFGFPCFDLVYCFLQTSRLIHRWSAAQASIFTSKVLVESGVDRPQAEALVRLSALEAYLRFANRSGDKSNDLQQFRLDVVNYRNPS